MEKNRDGGYDPLEKLLSGSLPENDSSTNESIDKAVRRARREVGAKDVAGLMFVNLWLVLAKILAPLFAIKK